MPFCRSHATIDKRAATPFLFSFVRDHNPVTILRSSSRESFQDTSTNEFTGTRSGFLVTSGRIASRHSSSGAVGGDHGLVRSFSCQMFSARSS
jgi:hypothetical protein